MRAGDVIAGRFELLAAAGAGGMGEIFRARDLGSGATVAVKVLLDRGIEPRRFEREARVLAELRHPGIVAYVAHGTTPAGRAWLAMEWLDGEDLAALLKRRPLTLDEGLALAAGVAEALAVVHARGVVHRDLKPENLFLPGGRVEQVKVLDFGIARRGDTARLTQTGALIGTPGYLAPEHLMAVLAKILFDDAPPPTPRPASPCRTRRSRAGARPATPRTGAPSSEMSLTWIEARPLAPPPWIDPNHRPRPGWSGRRAASRTPRTPRRPGLGPATCCDRE